MLRRVSTGTGHRSQNGAIGSAPVGVAWDCITIQAAPPLRQDHIIAITISAEDRSPIVVTQILKNQSAETIAPPPCVGGCHIA
jgi:hypothetical protein